MRCLYRVQRLCDISISYLNVGGGAAWPGQSRDTAVPASRVSTSNREASRTRGAAAPAGSAARGAVSGAGQRLGTYLNGRTGYWVVGTNLGPRKSDAFVTEVGVVSGPG